MTTDETAAAVPAAGLSDQPQRRAPSPDLLARRAGRALDPVSAVRFRDQRLQTTVYAGSQLLIRPTEHEDDIVAKLTTAADSLDLDIVVNDVDERLRAMARDAGIGPEDPQPLVLRVDLHPRWGEGPVSPPDAWPVLQAFRALYPPDRPERNAVQLDHVITSQSGPDTNGNPYWRVPGTTGNPYWRVPGSTGNPYWRVPGDLGEYATPGFGGRTPVSWVGAGPVRCPDEWMGRRRRPVVALLDTGVGAHPWLPDTIIDRHPRCGALSIGLTDPTTAPDDPAVVMNTLIGGLDATSGHGTFIAGLIRQKCPDANILAIRVIQGDGVVDEGDLLEALNMLWLRQKLAIINRRSDELIDLVSMSLGYYHEELNDVAFDPFLLAPLRALAQLGVAVITSAGNDATTRPMYPAAFAPYPGGLIPNPERDELPVVSVGAKNPDGSIALFSNEGPWVRAHRPGASLVSTLPAFDASSSPSLEVVKRIGQVRATIDPDDFTSGFGLWSGTSFAAPILVGEVAEFLNSQHLLDAREQDPRTAVDRGWKALSFAVPGLDRPGRPASTAPTTTTPATPTPARATADSTGTRP